MRVKCISNKSNFLPLDLKNNIKFNDEDTDLKINKIYTVYAIVINTGYCWYYICTHIDDLYPFRYPAPLFSITDPQLSKHWIIKQSEEDNEKTKAIFAYPEWINNKYHYTYVVDGETEEEVEHQELFQKYRQLMDLEFSDSEIDLKASSLDDGWAMCPICIDAWEPHSKDGMIICPTCKNVMHNPFYESIKPLIID